MKKSKIIFYMLGLTGLYIGLFYLTYALIYVYVLVYSQHPDESTAVLAYTVIYGIVFFFSHRALCLLLKKPSDITVAFIFAIVADSLFFYFMGNLGALFTCVNVYLLLDPLYRRKKEVVYGVPEQDPPVVTAPHQSVSSDVQNIYKCKYCHHTFKNDGIPHFCPKCSRDLLAQHRFCTNCGKENNLDSDFCTFCGKALEP